MDAVFEQCACQQIFFFALAKISFAFHPWGRGDGWFPEKSGWFPENWKECQSGQIGDIKI